MDPADPGAGIRGQPGPDRRYRVGSKARIGGNRRATGARAAHRYGRSGASVRSDVQVSLHPIQKSLLCDFSRAAPLRSEEHTSELQSLMRISYAVFSLKTKK